MKRIINSLLLVISATSFGQQIRPSPAYTQGDSQTKSMTFNKQPLVLKISDYNSVSNNSNMFNLSDTAVGGKKWMLMDYNYGKEIFKTDCTSEEQAFNGIALSYARTVVASKVFAEVLRDKMKALYGKCKGDPFYSSDFETQFQKVLAACRAPKNIQISCSGTKGNAAAGLGSYDLNQTPEFAWGKWLAGVTPSVNVSTICTEDQKKFPDTSGCRWAPFPWPYSQAAGIVWHELMHQYGYGHGADDQNDLAKTNCGISSNASWHFQHNTVPYIVESAINEVINKSHQVCGNISNCPDPNQLWLLDTYNGTTCSCVYDPGKRGFQLAPPDMAAKSGSITSVSRRADHMETFWIGGDGSIWNTHWYEGYKEWVRYQFAPPAIASQRGGITTISRRPDHMEVFWIGSDGSIWNAHWYEGYKKWNQYQFAPPGMASQSGGITAISRRPDHMEIFWIGGDGSIWNAHWYEGYKEWVRYQLAPPHMAAQSGGITAISRRPDHMEIFWIGGDGSIWDAHWYEGYKKWNQYQLAPPNMAAQSGSITAISRRPDHMEIFWVGGDGSVWDAHWYEGYKEWVRYQFAPPAIASQSGSITAMSRRQNYIEVFWVGGDGSIWAAEFDESLGTKWKSYQITLQNMASQSGNITAVSRRSDHGEVFWIGADGSVLDAHWYDAFAK